MSVDRSIVRFHSLLEGARELPLVLLAGHEYRTSQDKYDWDCRTRNDAHFVFQYTVSGLGEVEIAGQWLALPAGSAFLVEVPGPFRYRLPAGSGHWELQFVSLSRECLPWWTHLVTGLGRVIVLPSTHAVVRKLAYICKATQSEMQDAFANSAWTYDFLMELYRYQHALPSSAQLPHPVRLALTCIEQQAHRPIGLADIAAAAGVSKFHLLRLFQQCVGESPTRRLTKTRIANAARLLVETPLSIEQIAAQIGFQSGNYFAKAFRRWMDSTPSAFRAESGMRGVSRLEIT